MYLPSTKHLLSAALSLMQQRHRDDLDTALHAGNSDPAEERERLSRPLELHHVNYLPELGGGASVGRASSKYRQCLAGGQEESRLSPGRCHTGEKGALGRGQEAGGEPA